MENLNEQMKVACPHCGAEYLISEIYIPNSIFGKPDTIVKDALGKIIIVDYKEDPCYTEEFECEVCNKPFKTNLKITASASNVSEEEDIKDKVVSLLD